MARILSVIKKLGTRFSTYTANEFLVLIVVLSAFVSVFAEAAVILLLPFYILITKQWKKWLPENKFGYLLLLFSILAALSTFLYAKNVTLGDFELKALYLKLLSIAVIILVFDIYFFINIMTKRAFFDGLKLSCLLSAVCFIVGIFQMIFKIYANPARPNRYASLFMNENYYGTIIEFVVLICFYFLFQSKTLRNKVVFALLILINVFGLWLCQCRTAYIALAFSVLIFLSIRNKKCFWILSVAIVAAAVILIKNPSLLPRFDTSFENLSFRFGIWKAALKCFADNFVIGRGYYSYSAIWVEYSNVKFYAMHSHNLYIETFLNFGVLGAFSLGGYLIINIKNTLANCIFNHRRTETAFILAILSTILIHGVADITVFWPQTGLLAVMLLCCPKVFCDEKKKD